MELEKLISFLLLRHDCVILPGFGGFISQRIASSITQSGKLTPPNKRIVFNPNLQNDDGLLIGAYAVSGKKNYRVAYQEIVQLTEYWKRKLVSGLRIELEGIGYLFLNEDRKIQFEQDNYSNILPSSYGLPTLHDVLIRVTTEEENQETAPSFASASSNTAEESILFSLKNVETPTPSKEQKKHQEPKTILPQTNGLSHSFRWIRYAAAIFLLPILFYSFWIPMKTDFLESHILSFNDFNPFFKQEPFHFQSSEITLDTIVATQPKDIQKIIHSTSAENVFSFEINKNTYKNILLSEEKPQPANLSINESSSADNAEKNQFYLIGNCFKMEDNAKSYCQQMQAENLSAEIVDYTNGLYRVSIGKANTDKELQLLKEQLQQKGYTNYWILKK